MDGAGEEGFDYLYSLATRTRFDNRLRYLLKKEYIMRVSRGVYRISEKETKYMDVI